VLLTLLFTAHQGGSITHGGNYLTEYMPAPLKHVLSVGTASDAAPDSFYARQIHPIFDANCVACHGASKIQGGLRLDSYAFLIKGGKDGPVLVARNADKSVLLERVTLPAGDHHFMPAEGRPPLKPDQIAWIRAWIQQGASPTATQLAGVTVPQTPQELPLQPVGDYSAMMNEIHRMQQAQGTKLVPVYAKPSDGLILNTVDAPASFNDACLAQFQRFAPYIVEANLARTAVTDAGFATLASFTHLRALHLEGTAVTGSELPKLAPLSQLTYLNLSGTKVTSAALAPLKSMRNLRHVYLFNTPAEPALSADAARPVTAASK
jgi:mono/diheme cytochrome c family protein